MNYLVFWFYFCGISKKFELKWEFLESDLKFFWILGFSVFRKIMPDIFRTSFNYWDERDAAAKCKHKQTRGNRKPKKSTEFLQDFDELYRVRIWRRFENCLSLNNFRFRKSWNSLDGWIIGFVIRESGSQEIDVRGLQTFHPKTSSVNRIGQTGQRWVFRKPVNWTEYSGPVIRDRSIVTELPWIHLIKVIFIVRAKRAKFIFEC